MADGCEKRSADLCRIGGPGPGPGPMAVVGDGDARPTSAIRVPGCGYCGFDTAGLRSEQPGLAALYLCALMGALCRPMTCLLMSFPVAIDSGRSHLMSFGKLSWLSGAEIFNKRCMGRTLSAPLDRHRNGDVVWRELDVS